MSVDWLAASNVVDSTGDSSCTRCVAYASQTSLSARRFAACATKFDSADGVVASRSSCFATAASAGARSWKLT